MKTTVIDQLSSRRKDFVIEEFKKKVVLQNKFFKKNCLKIKFKTSNHSFGREAIRRILFNIKDSLRSTG